MLTLAQIDLAYKKIYWVAAVWTLISVYFLLIYPINILGIFLFSAIVLLGMTIFYYTVKILFLLPGKAPFKPLFAGLVLIIGGAFFDITNTILHSPDLSLESNPLILFLFNYNFSLFYIYCMSFLGQILLVTNFCLLWAVFLKAYPIMLQKAASEDFLSTSIKLLGGVNANFWKIMIGKVDPFFAVTSVIPVLVGLSFYRWYLGLEWLNLVPISRVIVPVVISISTLIIYLMVSYRMACKNSVKNINLPIISNK